MRRAYRIALKPTPEQESLFGQHAGYACFAYNWAVGEFKAGLDVGEWLSDRALRPRWNRVKPMIASWASVLSQNAAKYAIIDFGQAAASWGAYRKRAKADQRPGRHDGFPRFKRRRHEQGLRADNGPNTVRTDGRTVLLPKVRRIAMVEDLRFTGPIRKVTVNRTADVWFACFRIEDGQAAAPVTEGPTIGVDVSVGTTAVCSDGTVVANPRALARGIRGLRQVDRAIARSRNVYGKANPSNRRERLHARRLHALVVNVRSDRHHKATTAIAESAGRVAVETLNVAGMVRNRRLSSAISDADMAGFLAELEYKCLWYGAEYIQADRWFASSKRCSHCGWLNGEMTLSVREWLCSGCGELNDRDHNPAINLRNWPGFSFPVTGRGDRVRRAMPAAVVEVSMGSVLESAQGCEARW